MISIDFVTLKGIIVKKYVVFLWSIGDKDMSGHTSSHWLIVKILWYHFCTIAEYLIHFHILTYKFIDNLDD